MNRTNFEHLGYALVIQLAFWPLVGVWAGGLIGIAFFAGREHAQVQRKNQLGDFASFNWRYWTVDNRLDLVFPAVGCLVVAVCGQFI